MIQESKITALYCRLSQEELQAGESGSIQNQRLILQKYADEHDFHNTRFFIDDGVSGVSFDRTGLNAMLKEVEAGRVAAVITKDLSRLGRNYLKTGELIEIIFPRHGVRYIAISDGVDTAHHENEFTPLRNWFNEFYARDTSKKIRAVKQAKAQKGERVNGEYPYGYLLDPDNKNRLIPDPETVPIVRQIFDMYVKGERICNIQQWLADHQVLTIGALRYRRTGQERFYSSSLLPYAWPDKSIYDILARQEYLGHTVTGKTCKESYKSAKTSKIPEEKRYFFPDTHEAIIDAATFALAHKRLMTRHRPNKSDHIDIFSGLLFCGDCGHKMYLQQGQSMPEHKHAYTCGRYRNRNRLPAPCTTHYIRRTVISGLILADLKRVLGFMKQREPELAQDVAGYAGHEARKAWEREEKELTRTQSRLQDIDTIFRKLYEDHALGRIAQDRFCGMISGYEEEKNALKNKLGVLEATIRNSKDGNMDLEKASRLVRNYTQLQQLTYENLHELISRILIYEPDRKAGTRKMEIIYNFADSGATDSFKSDVRFRMPATVSASSLPCAASCASVFADG